jgi:hypothetical protein
MGSQAVVHTPFDRGQTRRISQPARRLAEIGCCDDDVIEVHERVCPF